MKAIHVVPALFSSTKGIVGGAERYAYELARFLSMRMDCSLLTFGDRPESYTDGSLKVQILGGAHYVRGQRNNPLSWEMFRELWQGDIVHCHQQHILSSSLTALARRYLGRKATVVSDLGGGGWDLSAYMKTDPFFDAHLHISQYSRKVKGHDQYTNAHVIYGGVDTEKFSPEAGVAREALILYVGRLLPHKGIDILVRAIGPGMRLEIIGRPYDETYHAELRRLAEGKAVVFRSDATDADIVQAYRRAACIVLPSVYTDLNGNYSAVPELLGQTLLEGMSCGAPAVCSDVASMPEIVEPGKNGFIVPPNDPEATHQVLLELVSSPSLVERLGLAARETVLRKFSWPAVAAHCESIYQSLVPAKAPPR